MGNNILQQLFLSDEIHLTKEIEIDSEIALDFRLQRGAMLPDLRLGEYNMGFL